MLMVAWISDSVGFVVRADSPVYTVPPSLPERVTRAEAGGRRGESEAK